MEYQAEYLESIAKVCHEANRTWCETHRDYSGLVWDKIDNELRQSAIDGVIWRLNNIDAPASAQHDAWMEHKIAQGWRYGRVKNTVRKTHPCLVFYDSLPKYQQIKDALFISIVTALR